MNVLPHYKSHISLLLLIVITSGLFLIPFQVKATVPTIDFTAIGKLILQLAELVKQTAEAIFQSSQLASLNAYFYILKPAVKFLASLLLQKLTQGIVGWIQEGGNTNFVSNLQAALTRTADEAAGEFLNQLAGINLCEPFSFRLRLALRVPRIQNILACTATQIFKNLQTSYDGFLRDFRSGGWLVFQTTLSGSNNYFDALINGYDAKLVAESRRVSVLQNQYDAGQGFLGVRVKKQNCQDFPEYENPICTTVDVQTTPGKLVSELLVKSVGSGIDQAININDIGQALDAIIAALINKLISSAQAGLLANDERSGIFDNSLGGLPPPQAPPPDLTISDGLSPNQQGIIAGDTVTFSGTIKNQGGSAVTLPFNARFQIDIGNDGTIDVTPIPNPTINGIGAGQEKTVISSSWTAVEGRHRVILCADTPNPVVDESLESNNCSLASSGLFTVGPKPDLMVSENPSIHSGAPTVGQSITFRGVIKNQGGAPAVATFQNSFQIDIGNNGTLDITLTPHPTIANLAPATTQAVISASWTAVEGTHRVVLCADTPGQVIAESEKANNCNPAGTGVFTIQSSL